MDIETNELDLEYMEQDAEERLSQRDALLLGVGAGLEGADYPASRWAEGNS